jgi:flagellar hook assembly protein FlgD
MMPDSKRPSPIQRRPPRVSRAVLDTWRAALGSVVIFLLVALSVPSRASLISSAGIDRSFSPNGDGIQDSTTVVYRLSDSALVYVIVFQKDSTSVVDTLVAGWLQPPDTSFHVSWDGTLPGGSPAPEDVYAVLIRARDNGSRDSLFLETLIDITDPQIVVSNIDPPVFAPSIHSQFLVDYTVFDPAPSLGSVSVKVDIIDTDGNTTTLSDSLLPADSLQRATWDGSSANKDGTYQIKIAADDGAGNSSLALSDINVDIDAPKITITSLTASSTLKVIPDSLMGWAWDRNGIDSLMVRYRPDPAQFETVTSTVLKMDTLFFSVILADSILDEQSHTINFRALDIVGRERLTSFSVTLDTTPPTPPLLDMPISPTREPSVRVTGTVDTDALIVRIFRNGVRVDSVTTGDTDFEFDMALLPGSNRISARAVDIAGNVSALSAEIEVVFDNSAGLFITQPFKPSDVFQINLSKLSTSVTLRIYDLSGNLVTVLRSDATSSNVAIPWDGLNGDGEDVRKGPLVAVAETRYQDGGREIFREIFLLDP